MSIKLEKKFGYAGKILAIDLYSQKFKIIPTSDYSNLLIGGRGIAARIYSEQTYAGISAFDPRNNLIIMTGPLMGLPGLAGSRWEICGKSPANQPQHFSWNNLGGFWGANLKFSGYDGVVVQGCCDKPKYLFLKDTSIELKDASHLWGKTSGEVCQILKSELGNRVRIITYGPAGDNQVPMATFLTDDGSSGAGLASVMGSKKLKAIVVARGNFKPTVANPEKLKELTVYIRGLQIGKAMSYMDWPQWPVKDPKVKPDLCFGCIRGCNRQIYISDNGQQGKFFCQAGNFYRRLALAYYGRNTEVPFYATRLCDTYGIDTKTIEGVIEWLSRCYKDGILNDQSSGMPISKIGSLEFIETLVKKIAFREDFGDVLAEGVKHAADYVGNFSKDLITDYIGKAGQHPSFGARMFIITGIFYAMEPRRPNEQVNEIGRLIQKWNAWRKGSKQGAYMSSDVLRAIAKRFWGSELAADFNTYEGKALAAKKIQDHQYAIECLILCNQVWPIMDIPNSKDHIGDPTLASKIYSAVTGNQVNEEELDEIGERVLNLIRSIRVQEGHQGRQDDQLAEYNYIVPVQSDSFNPDCYVPGKDGKPLSRKGEVLDRNKYNKVLEEYYLLREWDVPTGLQKKEKLNKLGLADVANELTPKGLAL